MKDGLEMVSLAPVCFTLTNVRLQYLLVLKTPLVSTLKVLILVHAIPDFKEMALFVKILTSAQSEVTATETPPVSTTSAALSVRVTAVSMEQELTEIVLTSTSVLTTRTLTVAMPTPTASTRRGPTCASARQVSKVMVTKVLISLAAPTS